jgi:hypothetical protein
MKPRTNALPQRMSVAPGEMAEVHLVHSGSPRLMWEVMPEYILKPSGSQVGFVKV